MSGIMWVELHQYNRCKLFLWFYPALLSLQCRCDSEEHSERQHCRSRWAHPHWRHHPVCEFHLKHNRWLFFFFFFPSLYCISWWQIPISASPNLHCLQLLVVPYMPIRVLLFFFSWWGGILPSISLSPCSNLALFLNFWLLSIQSFIQLPSHCVHAAHFIRKNKTFLSPFSPLTTLTSPSGGRGEPAGLQWAASHGSAEEDRSPDQAEAAEEGCPTESHPAPSSPSAAPPSLPQLPRGQSIQSGPQQDSRDRCFVLREGDVLTQW